MSDETRSNSMYGGVADPCTVFCLALPAILPNARFSLPCMTWSSTTP